MSELLIAFAVAFFFFVEIRNIQNEIWIRELLEQIEDQERLIHMQKQLIKCMKGADDEDV